MTPGGVLQTTIFVDPAAPGSLQTTIFVDPTAPGSLQTIIFVDLSALRPWAALPAPCGCGPPCACGQEWMLHEDAGLANCQRLPMGVLEHDQARRPSGRKCAFLAPSGAKNVHFQKLKVSKCVCRSPLAVVEAAPSLFVIFGHARGQIYWKKR